MTSTAQRLLKEALALPEQDRQRVAEVLLDSVPADDGADIERAWTEEAVRRAGAVERGETVALDGDGAVSGLEQKLREIHKG